MLLCEAASYDQQAAARHHRGRNAIGGLMSQRKLYSTGFGGTMQPCTWGLYNV